ncbi:Smr/MutS family protein [Nitrosomonas sp. Nm166]|uniref:Smr/MutS family protein n=1 Tax=Nitrosomonas sp. Nm166 TaxID=1881054 RepID=UPI0008E747E8|nr:Smr/MutS family protein [Nitrosomonas sp. Nm166]SFD87138.1 DNA-nicking endonuclease, Smr domain [Nitrosomonas sp. Nm166]
MTKKDSVNDEDEKALFRAAMHDVTPLPATDKTIQSGSSVAPVPRKKSYQEQAVTQDNFSDHIAIEIGAGDAWSYARPGISHQTLRRLRRGYWKIRENLDLHGLTRDEARRELSSFLDACIQKKYRCVRIIHGKGLSSKKRAPVLKTQVGNWLIQRVDVLAFCQARPEDGGGGAVLVLLKVSASSEEKFL